MTSFDFQQFLHFGPNSPTPNDHGNASFDSSGKRLYHLTQTSRLAPSQLLLTRWLSCYHLWSSHALLHAPAAAGQPAPDDGWRAPLGALLLRLLRATHQPPVACWPPVHHHHHHHWSDPPGGCAPFGEDDPTRGWEGRGNLQQRQCRSDAESCQHISGEVASIYQGVESYKLAPRQF